MLKTLLQACSGILRPNFKKEPFSLLKIFYLFWILITSGLMISIRKNRKIENNFNQNGPKNLDSFWLNSFLFGIVIYFLVFLNYIRG
jgi:hypothetical protein